MGVQCIGPQYLTLLGSNVRAILGSSRKRMVGSDRLLYKCSCIALEFKSREWIANVCLCMRFTCTTIVNSVIQLTFKSCIYLQYILLERPYSST